MKRTILSLELLEPLPLLGRQARSPALVPLGLAHPLPERLRGTADLLGDRGDRRPLRIVRRLVLHDHPHGPLTHFRGEPARSCHGPILSRSGASRKPGAVQSFLHGGTTVGLDAKAHATLIRLAEAMVKTRQLRDTVSVSSLSDQIFKWVKARYEGTDIRPMTNRVLAAFDL